MSYELFDTNDIRGLTCHSMRNLGYVLSCWGEGNIEDEIFDADHSPCSKSYQLYTRDTLRVYEEWKQNSNCLTAVNVLVPRWKKKKKLVMYASEVGIPTHSVLLHQILFVMF